MSNKKDYDWTVNVSGLALKELLEAISGPPHHLREMMVLANMGSLSGMDNPLTILFEQYNSEVRRLKAEQEQSQQPVVVEEPAPPAPPPPPPEPGDEATLDFYLTLSYPVEDVAPNAAVFFDTTPLQFGENDLTKIVVSEYCNRARRSVSQPQVSLDGIFDEELIVTDFLVELDCEGEKYHFTLPITGGKAVAAYKDLQNKVNPAFNVTMSYRDRLFTFEGYMGFDRKSGIFTSTLANFTTDIGLHKLPAVFGFPGVADSIKPIGLHVKGKYHTHVLKDSAKNS